ncbi:dihydrofolate reductase [Aestuariimicrobium ganziense]|uniref:dihydrofolate reductase n=1 Tax=Aestuariimicrobium ganziense TaxID=2773677 RepID=UPI001943C2D5
MQVISIAAVADNRVIGNGPEIPWRIKEDWDRFRERTTGHFLVLGRETFEQIGDPLPNRTSIVVTRNTDWEPPEAHGATRVLVAHSIDEAIHLARTTRGSAVGDICFIGGGGEIYAQTMDKVTGLDITEVHQSPEGDAYYPEIDPDQWVEISRDERDGFDFVRYAPVVRTESLELRPITLGDADAWSRISAEHTLEEHNENWLEDGLGLWMVRNLEGGDPVGVAGVHTHVLPNKAKVWVFHHRLSPETEHRSWAVEVAKQALVEVNRIDPLGRVRVIVRQDDPKAIQAVLDLGLEKFDDRVGPDGEPETIYQGVARELV